MISSKHNTVVSAVRKHIWPYILCTSSKAGAHQMEPPSPLISWVNPFPSRVINRTTFFCNALGSHECACCLLSFLYFHWLFPPLARETSPGNRSLYKSTRERVDSKGLCGRWRLQLMGSCSRSIIITTLLKHQGLSRRLVKLVVYRAVRTCDIFSLFR